MSMQCRTCVRSLGCGTLLATDGAGTCRLKEWGSRVAERILLINDLCGYGTISLGAMDAVLSHMRFQTSLLPTALVSSTLNRPQTALLDTSAYVRDAFGAWDALGVSFDAIATGLIASEDEAEAIADFCSRKKGEGAAIFVDPIMGDNGALYRRVDPSAVERMRRLVQISDYAVPNATEACLLAGTDPAEIPSMTEEGALGLVERLRAMGASSLAITSCTVDEESCVVGYDAKADSSFILPIDYIPCYFAGTGDIFSSIVLGKIMQQESLEEACALAMQAVRTLIWRHQDQEDVYLGLPLEQEGELLDSLA